ncbi:hypothetical protein AGOR_G00156190 [Albula goreensis]|uniref:CG-1 domain-containing protein n=1 Tax=Albula goreensis TaxID=1534307 RepID=A0A8T3D7R2_9TELE|nr:hypothetical protein AGOR_G00156190 [Albula goreensis]
MIDRHVPLSPSRPPGTSQQALCSPSHSSGTGLLQQLTNALGQRKNCSLSLEIAAYLITFEKHEEWLTTSPKTRPQNGSMILYNRKKVKYRKDGYCWKKRKDGKTTREDHMKLKVQGVEVRGGPCGRGWGIAMMD